MAGKGQVLSTFNSNANDLRKPTEEIGTRSGNLIAADKSTVISKALFDAVAVKDGQGEGRLSDPPLGR
jgi:hypothetical protein